MEEMELDEIQEKDKKRSERRSQRMRMQKVRERVLKESWRMNEENDPYFKDRVKRMTDTPKPCSCYMCGNPRKYFSKKTRQELRSELDFIDENEGDIQ